MRKRNIKYEGYKISPTFARGAILWRYGILNKQEFKPLVFCDWVYLELLNGEPYPHPLRYSLSTSSLMSCFQLRIEQGISNNWLKILK